LLKSLLHVSAAIDALKSLENALSKILVNYLANGDKLSGMGQNRSVPDTVLHVINHTHWDREWFAPYNITMRWIPGLIQNLSRVVDQNPKYEFLLDAQTQVLEDLKDQSPSSFKVASELIKNHNLAVGPYYVQLEMRNSTGESLVRNIRVGTETARSLGASTEFTAWSVDYFGHVSQSPQIHALFGIRNVYLWRGPSKLAPFFWWEGPDGTRMLAVDLFAGGYRNFYKVTSKQELALPRLEHEVQKLRPFYPQGNIPVFDGFDLDKEPGDSATYFAKHHADAIERDHIRVTNSSPYRFAETVRQQQDQNFPTLSGELISGKYSSVFPGTLSTRVYSKLLSTHCEQLLYRYAEPINLLMPPRLYPEQLFETQTNQILKNLVHDVISGCSIDQVHDYAELRSLKIEQALRDSVQSALSSAASKLPDGTYAFVPTTGKSDAVVVVQDTLYSVKGSGVGIVEAEPVHKIETTDQTVDRFTWSNSHYEATLGPDGVLNLGSGKFGALVVRLDDGDAYWDEPRGEARELRIAGPIKVTRVAEGLAQLSFAAETSSEDKTVDVKVELTFDQSPVIKWRLILNTSGTGFSVALRHNYGYSVDKLNVGMQFDNVERDFEDTDLLGRELEPPLNSLLIGQRDILKTYTFPFHAYVSPCKNPDGVHLLAKGLKAYQTEQKGIIDLVLTRPVEWVMKPGIHKYHSGDAGPKYLVPGARAERETVIECGLLMDQAGPSDVAFHQSVDRFINPPLLFSVENSRGAKTSLPIFDEEVPVSSLHQYRGSRLARVFNPSTKSISLNRSYVCLAGDREVAEQKDQLTPKRILSLEVEPVASASGSAVKVELLNWPTLPVGPDKSKATDKSLQKLKHMSAELEAKQNELAREIEDHDGHAPSSLLHRYYVVARELMEAKLSMRWNEMRARPGSRQQPYAIDDELYKMATEYNDMRIIRRMYDYIVGIDAKGLEEALPAKRSGTNR
jgi:alpha-mannosidase